MIRRIEEASFNAWPAREEVLYDGWLLRAANGYTGRANSVNVLNVSTLDIGPKIRVCEQFYQQRGLPPTFRVTPLAQDDELDTRLAEAGYRRNKATLVLSLELNEWQSPPNKVLETHYQSIEEWLIVYQSVYGAADNYWQAHRRVLETIVPPKRLISLQRAGRPVSAGMAVLDAECVGLFSLVTAADERRKGYGTQLIESLLRWAQENGAARAYLQVQADNAPALSLYRKLGFDELYPYWYRVKEAA